MRIGFCVRPPLLFSPAPAFTSPPFLSLYPSVDSKDQYVPFFTFRYAPIDASGTAVTQPMDFSEGRRSLTAGPPILSASLKFLHSDTSYDSTSSAMIYLSLRMPAINPAQSHVVRFALGGDIEDSCSAYVSVPSNSTNFGLQPSSYDSLWDRDGCQMMC